MLPHDQPNPMPPKLNVSFLTTPPNLPLNHPKCMNLSLAIEPDDGALQEHQRDLLLDLVQADRLADKDYLRQHPEVKAFVNLIFKTLVLSEPDNMFDHLDRYFNRPVIEVKVSVQREMDRIASGHDTDSARSEGSKEEEEPSEQLVDDVDEVGSMASSKSSNKMNWGSLANSEF